MPCSEYSGRQRKACYATDEWKRPIRKRKGKTPAAPAKAKVRSRKRYR